MIGVLFWNVGLNIKGINSDRKVSSIDNAIVHIVAEHHCDIIVLAEYNFPIENLCNKLCSIKRDFSERKSIVKAVRVKVVADKRLTSEVIRDSRYYVIHNFSVMDYHFLVGGVHFPSKLHANESDLMGVGSTFIKAIEEAEKEVSHKNVIMVGDFNVNPFEKVMINFYGVHAIPNAKIAGKTRARKLFGEKKQIFYNPMWNLLGDNSFPYGSYYSDGGNSDKLFWNLFDQIVISADFINAYNRDSLQIISGTTYESLINATQKPDNEHFSDHLPIYFSFKEDQL